MDFLPVPICQKYLLMVKITQYFLLKICIIPNAVFMLTERIICIRFQNSIMVCLVAGDVKNVVQDCLYSTASEVGLCQQNSPAHCADI